jgi:hypothetical protein
LARWPTVLGWTLGPAAAIERRLARRLARIAPPGAGRDAVRRLTAALALCTLLTALVGAAGVALLWQRHRPRPPLEVRPDPPLPDGPPILHPTDGPLELLDKAVAALGGPTRVGRWRCGRVKYQTRSDTIYPLDQKPSTVEEFFQLPGRFKRIAEIGEGSRRRTATFIINGEQGWELLPDGSTKPLPNVILLTVYRNEHAFADFYNLSRLRSPYFQLSTSGLDHVDGREVVVLHSEAFFANPTDYAFDRITGLLLKTTRHVLQPGGGEKTIETFLGDYRDIGGGPVPLHIVGRSEGRVLLDFTIYELEFLDQLDEALFAVPE